jgi:hypothetical protein
MRYYLGYSEINDTKFEVIVAAAIQVGLQIDTLCSLDGADLDLH